MDKRALKSIIIELKQDKHKTFTQIAYILENEYNIKMTRQAVCGMYNRSMSAYKSEHNKELLLSTNDIINYYTLGMKLYDIKRTMELCDIKVSLGEVKNTIEENSVYINNIKNDQIKICKKAVDDGSSIEDITSMLSFKGYNPSLKVVKRILKLACKESLKDSALAVFGKYYNITDNPSFINTIINEHNFDIKLKELSKEINQL